MGYTQLQMRRIRSAIAKYRTRRGTSAKPLSWAKVLRDLHKYTAYRPDNNNITTDSNHAEYLRRWSESEIFSYKETSKMGEIISYLIELLSHKEVGLLNVSDVQ